MRWRNVGEVLDELADSVEQHGLGTSSGMLVGSVDEPVLYGAVVARWDETPEEQYGGRGNAVPVVALVGRQGIWYSDGTDAPSVGFDPYQPWFRSLINVGEAFLEDEAGQHGVGYGFGIPPTMGWGAGDPAELAVAAALAGFDGRISSTPMVGQGPDVIDGLKQAALRFGVPNWPPAAPMTPAPVTRPAPQLDSLTAPQRMAMDRFMDLWSANQANGFTDPQLIVDGAHAAVQALQEGAPYEDVGWVEEILSLGSVCVATGVLRDGRIDDLRETAVFMYEEMLARDWLQGGPCGRFEPNDAIGLYESYKAAAV